MRRTIEILFLTLIGLGLMDLTPAEVTHEEIRGTLQSLVYSYNQLDSKLERHEHRERALGELLKKAMQSLQKGQKSLEPLNDIYARLDERVGQVEGILLAQEEKYNIQTEKLGEALDHMFKWMRENDECYKRPPIPGGALVASPVVAGITPEFVQQQEKMNKELLAQLKQLSTNVEKLVDNSKDMMQQSEVAFKSLPSTAEMLTKIEDKLVSYSVAPPAAETTGNKEFEEKLLEQFNQLTSGLNELRAAPQSSEGLTSADKEFMQSLTNETLNALEHVKIDALSATDKALAKSTARIKETEENIESTVSKVLEGVTDSAEVLEKFYGEMNASYGKMNDAVEVFNKFNTILMMNSEYVLETHRKVDFATVQIVQKINQLLDKQHIDVTELLKQRFDSVDESIVSHHIEAAQNISSFIESEISHVWRQIEIMNSEVADSKDLLRLMQGRNEVYVNSTFSTMDSMSKKVEATRERMLDMDSNLNFLLGKLSVMSQEFGNIKIGLAQSLEELRKTFHAVQEKMPTQGPGPHTISKNEYETEVNLLQKRHTN